MISSFIKKTFSFLFTAVSVCNYNTVKYSSLTQGDAGDSNKSVAEWRKELLDEFLSGKEQTLLFMSFIFILPDARV